MRGISVRLECIVTVVLGDMLTNRCHSERPQGERNPFDAGGKRNVHASKTIHLESPMGFLDRQLLRNAEELGSNGMTYRNLPYFPSFIVSMNVIQSRRAVPVALECIVTVVLGDMLTNRCHSERPQGERNPFDAGEHHSVRSNISMHQVLPMGSRPFSS